METRKERFAKYRETIQKMPDGQFPAQRRFSQPNSGDLDLLSSADKPTAAISYGSLLESSEAAVGDDPSGRPSPYARYSNKKKGWLIAKFVLLFMAIIAMVIYYFLWVK